MPAWIIALLGVFVGFGLNEVSQLIKAKLLSKKLNEALEDELSSNLYQLDDKIDIANQMITALNQRSILSGLSVPFASSVYDYHFQLILKNLCPIQRDNIRHIYSKLRVLDEVMFSLEKSYKEDIRGGILRNAKVSYIGKIKDVLNNYNTLKKLIKLYLDGSPEDIYHRDNHNT